MKYSPSVTSSRRKCRKAHFNSPSHIRRKLMSSTLCKELRNKHGIRSLPIRKDDEVVIKRGQRKGTDIYKVMTVRRQKFVVYLQGLKLEKNSGVQVQIGVHPSNVEIVKIKFDKDRKNMIDRKSKYRFTDKTKGKVEESEIKA